MAVTDRRTRDRQPPSIADRLIVRLEVAEPDAPEASWTATTTEEIFAVEPVVPAVAPVVVLMVRRVGRPVAE